MEGGPAPLPPALASPSNRCSTGWSRPVDADHAELAALEAAQRLAARARRHPDRPPDPRCGDHCADGMEVLKDGTELHLASFCLADAELRLAGTEDPPFAALKVKYADVLGGAPPGVPPDRGMELQLETGDARIPRSRPVKRLSDGELAELRAQLIDLLDRCWIQHSTAGHAACVGGFRAQAGRVVVHLLRLPGPQRDHAPGGRAAPAHRRAARRHAGIPPFHQARSGQ